MKIIIAASLALTLCLTPSASQPTRRQSAHGISSSKRPQLSCRLVSDKGIQRYTAETISVSNLRRIKLEIEMFDSGLRLENMTLKTTNLEKEAGSLPTLEVWAYLLQGIDRTSVPVKGLTLRDHVL